MPNFEQLMRQREGVKTKVVLDKARKPVVGIGHAVLPVDKLKLGDEITEQQVSAFFRVDGAKAMTAARSQMGKAGIKSPAFLVYLAAVNFQLGKGWFRSARYKGVWQLVLEGKYPEAAKAVGGTPWQKREPRQAKDFTKALLRLQGGAEEA